ncbi:MAG TPA: MgtC/SapB family protein [Ilumatobacter sp.]|nr:MgtC/SapB family protein [Ilumatobacter sp.]
MAALEWYEVVGRLGLAALLGAVLGIEREFDGNFAGLRTHLLLTLGAALFTVVSVAGFDAFVATQASTNVTIDITRIAAYIAPGVGFIGGGAILKSDGRIRGLTTAASLWTAAAIGVAAGLGFWVGAVTATVIALIALEGLQPLSRWAAALGERRGRQER